MYFTTILVLLCILNPIYGASVGPSGNFELSIIHLNDFHARFEEIDTDALTCTNASSSCIGGFSRLYAAIKKLKEQIPESIVLDAGDSFQGTIWYTHYKWNAVQHFINKIPFDVHTLGNHEFDDNISGLVPYLKSLKAPVVVANIDDSDEPTIQGLYKKSVVVKRQGLKIGIIGAIVSTTNLMSNPGKLKFLNEIESINREAERLVAQEDVDTIIVLSHCGYGLEKEIAEKAAPKIGLVIGGHSHSLLFTGTAPDHQIAEGDYPTIVKHEDGRNVLVVQASAYTKFLGHITVTYNKNGDVVSWEGKPIYLDNSIEQDAEINNELDEWKKPVHDYGDEVVGRSAVYLDGVSCTYAECSMGNFLADAMVHAYLDTDEVGAWAYASIGLMHSGGIRTSLRAGDINVINLIECVPFQTTYDVAELQGKYIKDALEVSARPFVGEKGDALSLLQVSGIRVVINVTNEIGSRVQSVKVRCRECRVPSFEDIDMEKYYRVASSNYLMDGKDGFVAISDNIINRKVGKLDVEVLKKYIGQQSPIILGNEGRITIVK